MLKEHKLGRQREGYERRVEALKILSWWKVEIRMWCRKEPALACQTEVSCVNAYIPFTPFSHIHNTRRILQWRTLSLRAGQPLLTDSPAVQKLIATKADSSHKTDDRSLVVSRLDVAML